MIVDDHPSFRRFAGRMLAAAGYDVIGEAPDAGTALAEASRLRPTLVLLDVLLRRARLRERLLCIAASPATV